MSVKSKMSGDILSLFSKFGFGHLLCRLSLEKHDGISAVQLILSLCLFRINGETIHSIYKEMRKNFEIMAQALEDRQREEYVAVNTF